MTPILYRILFALLCVAGTFVSLQAHTGVYTNIVLPVLFGAWLVYGNLPVLGKLLAGKHDLVRMGVEFAFGLALVGAGIAGLPLGTDEPALTAVEDGSALVACCLACLAGVFACYGRFPARMIPETHTADSDAPEMELT